jgi:L-alanine-DL-glutamate epimerase-like enolase superfamily enzyme
MRIAKVEAIRIREPEWSPPKWWSTTPTDILFDTGARMREMAVGLFNAPIEMRADDVTVVIVRVTTDDGIHGLGGIALGSEAMARVVEGILAPLVIGASPFDVELLWEKMYRSTINIGRKGMVLEAISGIDIALWDIMGKAVGQPVYNLLGGRTRSKLRAYASSLYAMKNLDELAGIAAGYKRDGFTAMKMRFGWGPQDGRPGMMRNVELVQAVRGAIGPEIDLMADAYMGWTAQYAIEMIRMLEPFHLAWIEEPVIPDDIEGYARIKRETNTAIAGGEHEFTRWGFRELIERRAVDWVQLDVNRVGGITEARKVVALAQAFNLPVVPHAHNYHNLHLVMASANMPLAEFFPHPERDGDTFFSELFHGEPMAENGFITLSEKPGFGVELNEEVVARYVKR